MSALAIVDPGVHSTVQDLGRRGVRHHGLAQGGPLDVISFAWANKLVENPWGSPCVEIVLGGFRAVARGKVRVALTGAQADVRRNGCPVGMWRTLDLADGDELHIHPSRDNRLIYLAAAGGVLSASAFGSQSVISREPIEHLRPLAAGQLLELNAEARTRIERVVPDASRPDFQCPPRLRIVPGYQHSAFARTDLLRLRTSDYRVTDESDRMGFRLHGTPLREVPPGIVSEGVTPGAIQVPGNGQPIVLLNDCQTIGGYPKPGTLAALDRAFLAQQLPGTAVGFTFSDVATVQNDWRLFVLRFRNAHWTRSGDDLSWG